jgi:hypothetical protein
MEMTIGRWIVFTHAFFPPSVANRSRIDSILAKTANPPSKPIPSATAHPI